MDYIQQTNVAADRDLRQPGLSSQITSDIFFDQTAGNAGASVTRSSFGNAEWGSVMDSIPFWGVCTVSVPGKPTIICADGTSKVGDGGISAQEYGLLLPGTSVAVIVVPGSAYGIIVAASPPTAQDERSTRTAKRILPSSGAMGISSPMYDFIRNSPNGAGGLDLSSGAPVDQVHGDRSCLGPLDVGWFIGMTMVMLRSNDNCSVELHYPDMLMRLHGHNFEKFTAVSEQRELDDEGEGHIVKHTVKFPHEALGTKEHGATVFRPGDSADNREAFEGGQEPLEAAQTGAWRSIELGGYLGDMFRTQVQRPSDSFATSPSTYGGFDSSDGSTPAALSDVLQSSDGSIALSSAKRLIFRKTSVIPSIVQNRLPDDSSDGDGIRNHLVAGLFGEGEDPPESVEFDWGEDVPGNAGLEATPDFMAHFFMWYSLLTVREHTRDWVVSDVPNPSAGGPNLSGAIGQEKLEELAESFWAGMPEMRSVEIDTRKGSVNFYEGTSTIAQMDDGSIILEDAWGSCIQMTRGNIIIRPVANLMVQAGQRIVEWSGLDHIIRSRGCIDMTATKGDLRAAVGRNMQFLSGNDESNGGYGGILLESRATVMDKDFNAAGEGVKDSGVTILAKNSRAAVIGGDVYVGTSGEGFGRPSLTVDASRGNGTIYEAASHIVRRADTDFLDYFGKSGKVSYKSPSVDYTQSGVTIVEGSLVVIKGDGGGGTLVTEGATLIGAGLMAKDSIVSINGAIAGTSVFGKDGVAYYNPGGDPTMVAPADTNPLDGLKDQAATVAKQTKSTAKQVVTAQKKDAEEVEKAVRVDNHPGGEKLIDSLGVSLRTDDDYNVEGFVLAEPAWKERISGLLTAWEEMKVTAPGGLGVDTGPFPGMKYYEGDALVKRESTLVDPDTGDPKPPGEEYESAGMGDIADPVGLNEYMVFSSKYDE